jgi:hypothetical protein
MFQLEIEDREAEVLHKALEDYVSELRMEVANTDSQEVRDDLKETERVLTNLLSRLHRRAS